jgi:hypothetical protein
MIQHPGIDQTFHEVTAVLRQSYGRQPLIPDPLMVHVSKCQRLKQANYIAIFGNI